ncbi:hypothetical protein TWF281_000056 [Arthrobotrys megalospora]
MPRIFPWPTCLAGYVISYLTVWVSPGTAKPDCNAANIVIDSRAGFNKSVRGCKELGGNLVVELKFEGIEIDGLERIRGNLFMRDMIRDVTDSTTRTDPGLIRDLVIGKRTFEDVISIANLRVDGDLDISWFGRRNTENDFPTSTFQAGWLDVGGIANIHDNHMPSVEIWIEKADKVIIRDNLDLEDKRNLARLPLYTDELEIISNTLMNGSYADRIYNFPDMTEMGRKIYIEACEPQIIDNSNNEEGPPPCFGLRMPKLQSVPEVYLKDIPVVYLPNIGNINKSLELRSGDITKLELPELANIGTGRDGAFILRDLEKLFKLDLPALETIQGKLEFFGNALLKDISGFEALRSVSGDITLNGPISSLTLPRLANVDGNFTIVSSAPFNCTPWNEKQINTRFVKGDYSCDGRIDSLFLKAGFERSSVDSVRSGSGPPQSAPDRTPIIAGSSIAAVVAIVGIGFGVFYFRRRPRKFPDLLPGIANPELGAREARLYEVDGDKTEITAEAVGHIPSIEVDGDFQPVEMFVSDTIPAELDGSVSVPVQPPPAVIARRPVRNSGGGRHSWAPRNESAFTRFFRTRGSGTQPAK